jgi:hypothetical protein
MDPRLFHDAFTGLESSLWPQPPNQANASRTLGDSVMKPNSGKSSKSLLAWVLIAGGSASGVAFAAPPTQSFYIYGQAQILQGQLRLTTPFIGRMSVDSGFTHPAFGQVGRVTSIAVEFPLLWNVPTFKSIITQGPEISGITPLKYDVTLRNEKGQRVQFQFTTLDSPARYPGLGTRMGSLVEFNGGSFMQGSNSGPLDIGFGHRPIFLQNFRGQIAARR